ncbi:MAG: YlbF family regulator [Clostridiales bacterium]
MEIFNKAKELAKMIEESKELSDLKTMEIKVYEDEDSKTLTEEYSEIYNKFTSALNNQDEEEIALLKESYSEIMNKINENELTRTMFEAKEEFDKMIETINKIVNFAITGNEEDSSKCSTGSCSCSGCK